jgi:heptosyltransferase-2
LPDSAGAERRRAHVPNSSDVPVTAAASYDPGAADRGHAPNKPLAQELGRILIVRLGSLGDILLTTPVLRELAMAFPRTELHYLTRERYRELLVHNPCVAHIHTLPGEPGPLTLLRAGARLRALGFDLVIDLHRSFRSHLVRTALSPTSEIVYKGALGRRSLPDSRTGTPLWPSLAERFLGTLTAFGVQPRPQRLEFYVDPGSVEAAAASLGGLERPVVAIAPGARWLTKRWMPEGFAAVADSLKKHRHAGVVLVGDDEDADVCRQVTSLMREEARVLVGLPILETAAVLERCRLLVCNDSGLFHVARAMGTPAVAVFGPTGPQMGYYPWEPYARVVSLQMPCSPCTSKGSRRCPKRHFRCMKDLSSDAVLQAAQEMWEYR